MNKTKIFENAVVLFIACIFALSITSINIVAKNQTEAYKAHSELAKKQIEIYRQSVKKLQYEESEHITENYIVVDPGELELLAIAICQEGGGDSVCDECRYRIGDVVINRVNDPRFPDTLQEVLEQEGQYGRFHWTGVKWPDRASNASEQAAVERAKETAYNLLADIRHSDMYGNGYIWQAEFKQGTDIVECCGIYYGR